DKGMLITLKANNTTKITASFYNPYDMPGSIGANDYRANIDGCNPNKIYYQGYPPETGNMVGPTQQGMDGLINQDPNAQWDTSCNCITGSKFPNVMNSPRVTKIPVYNPIDFLAGPAHGKNIVLNFTNMIGFFIEPLTGAGEVQGHIFPIMGEF